MIDPKTGFCTSCQKHPLEHPLLECPYCKEIAHQLASKSDDPWMRARGALDSWKMGQVAMRRLTLARDEAVVALVELGFTPAQIAVALEEDHPRIAKILKGSENRRHLREKLIAMGRDGTCKRGHDIAEWGKRLANGEMVCTKCRRKKRPAPLATNQVPRLREPLPVDPYERKFGLTDE